MRITVVATSVVAVALVLGAVVFWFTLRASLIAELREAAEQDASAIAEQIEAAEGGTLGGIDDDRLVQVVDDSGTVVAASEDAPRTSLADAADEIVETDEGRFVIAVEGISGEAGGEVVAGRNTESADETLVTVAGLLAISVPLLIVLVAFTSWIVVGRALSPVERMRRQVAAMTAATLERRIDEPGADDEIGRLAHTLNGMLERLESAQTTQRRFISDASHELRSPLTVLRQYAEVARDHPERISARELADAVLDEGGRLERLVQGMLVLARADEGALHITEVDVDLDDLLLDEAKRVRSGGAGATAAAVTAAVTVDTSGIAAARVRGDLGLLRQLVRNLVDNAARHARMRIALAVAPSADGASVVLTVADDGDGIAPADRDRVFERFVRLDDARARDTGGSGLGLAIVREIATVHGGTARVDDGLDGRGARVTVTMPVQASLSIA